MLEPTFIRRMLRLAMLFVLCTLLAVYFASATFADYSYRGYDISWREQLVRALADWWPWVLLGPIVLLLATFPREGRGGWIIALLIHVPAGLFCAATKTLIRVTALNAFYGSDNIRMGLGELARAVLIYWAIIAIVRGLDYQRHSRERRVRLSDLESQLARSRLDALRMQLHPHFLFNTLHAISTLMRRDAEAAERMITRLGDLLRLSLEREGAHLVTLKQEIDLLRRYLEIEAIRFGDRLEVTIEVDDGLLDALVPNLILQPLVENAVRHGISQRAGPGHVVVRAIHQRDHLVLEIVDDGPGLPDERPLPDGVGLRNTRARLEQLYRGAASFTIDNAPTGGAVVRMTLPIDQAELTEGLSND